MKFVFCLDSGTFSTDLSPARAIRRLHVLLEPASIPCSNVKNHQCQDAQSIQRTQRQPLLKHKDNSCVCHGNHDTVLQVLGLYVIWTSGFARISVRLRRISCGALLGFFRVCGLTFVDIFVRVRYSACGALRHRIPHDRNGKHGKNGTAAGREDIR